MRRGGEGRGIEEREKRREEKRRENEREMKLCELKLRSQLREKGRAEKITTCEVGIVERKE
jgi:hypothetical protein